MRKTSFLALLFTAAFLATGAAESPYGVCAHLNRMPETEAAAELDGIRRCGIGFVRTDLDWKQIEPEPGKWDFSRWDKVVAEAEKQGVKVLPILCGEMPTHGKPPFRNQESWLRYVEQCVTRYKGRIDCYEVINEADCDRPWGEKPDGANYAELLKKTAAVIRRIDPRARILFTGVSDFGDPTAFVEAAFRAGAGKYFDAMNFHPYQWRNPPESQLPLRIRDLRTLMRKYGIDKPVWITEIGHSSAPDRFPVARQAVPAALKRLGFDPERDTVGVIEDTETLYSTGDSASCLPEWKKRRKLTFAELPGLDIAKCPILLLAGSESFPSSRFDTVLDFVRRGGTLVSPGGFPFYFDQRESETPGLFRTVRIGARLLPRLHLGWESFWVKANVPRTTTAFEPGEEFPGLRIPHRPSMRFLTGKNLKGNDRMIPLVYGVNGSYRGPVAALYRFDSELRGNAVVVVDADGTDSTSEERQAQLLPREYLLAFSEGVEKVFLYRFRAGEWNRGREAHFGIVRRNQEPKPAFRAYETLVRQFPPGSSRPEIDIENGVYHARWSRPDGTKREAFWTLFSSVELPLSAPRRGTDLYGAPVTAVGKLEVTPSVVYLDAK